MRVPLLLVWAGVTCGSAREILAQDVRGTVIDDSTGAIVSRVRVSAISADSVLLAASTSDDNGRFRFRVEPRSDFRITAARIGYSPNASAMISAEQLETLEIQLRITSRPLALPSVSVVASKVARTSSDRRLERAKTLGGRIISPSSIRAAAPTARTLGDLMRRVAGASVQVVSGYGASTCLLVQRNANLQQRQTCALLVVDDVASGGDAFVAPTDVEFIVVVPASAATVRFGERGRNGAVVVYTRVGVRESPPADG